MSLKPIVERAVAVVIALLGVAMTSAGSLVHMEWLKAPGAIAILVGGCWLGIALASQNVMLSSSRSTQQRGDHQ